MVYRLGVRVRVTGTSISRAEAEKWHEKAQDNFRIEYRRIVDDKTLWSPVKGVKLLLIEREEREDDEVASHWQGPTGTAIPYMVVPGPTGPVTYVPVSHWSRSTGPTGPAQPF